MYEKNDNIVLYSSIGFLRFDDNSPSDILVQMAWDLTLNQLKR